MNLRSTVISDSKNAKSSINPVMVITDYVPGMIEDLDTKIKFHEDSLKKLKAHREKLHKLLSLATEI